VLIFIELLYFFVTKPYMALKTKAAFGQHIKLSSWCW